MAEGNSAQGNSVVLSYHPKYLDFRDDWILWRDLYEGKHKTLTKPQYLWPHVQESKGTSDSNELRDHRANRTRYLNLIEIIISLWQGLFFKTPPTIEGMDEKVVEDVDGNGTSFYSFLKNEVLRDYFLYGKAIAIVDASPFTATSRAQEEELGLRPYIETIPALSMVDWDIETVDPKRIGKYNFARYKYTVVEPRKNETQAPTVQEYSRALRSDGTAYIIVPYLLHEEQKNTKSIKQDPYVEATYMEKGSPIQTNLKEIPISVMEDDSWVKDLAQEALRYYNLRSNHDNILYHQGWQKLFGIGVETAEHKAALSENLIAFIPKDGDIKTVEPVDTTAITKAMDESMAAAFKVGLNQLRMLPSDSRVGQSEDAQAEEKQNRYELVESTLAELEDFARDVLNNCQLFINGKEFSGKVELCKSLGEQSIENFVLIYNSFARHFQENEVLNKITLKEALKKMKLPEQEMELALAAADTIKASKPREESRGLIRDDGGAEEEEEAASYQ